jgi:copper transport protein
VPISLVVLRPSFADLGESWDEGRRRLAARLEGMVQAAIVASALSTAVALVLQAVLVADLERAPITAHSFTAVLQTTFGEWYALRLPLLAGLAVMLIGRVRKWALAGAGDDRTAPKWTWWVAWGAMGAGLLATTSFSGHAAVGHPRVLSLLNDLIHLVTVSTWFTGIVVLAIVLPDGWLHQPANERPKLLAPVVTRFSHVALISIAIVAITGTFNSLFDVRALNDLIDSGYGRTLAVKIGLFLVILALGGVNHFFLRERLNKAAAGEKTDAQRVFRRSIAVELVVAIALMATTGLLVGLAKTRNTAPAPASRPASSGPRP